MPTQQRLEGPDLEQLLADARAEHGPDVAIVEANKIRTGGIGGFFAREGFEVVVEIEEPVRPATSILDLADAIDDGPGPLGVGPDSAAALLDAVAEQRARGDAPLVPSSPSVSTEGDSFAEVLGRLADEARGGGQPMPDAHPDAAFEPYSRQAAKADGRVVRAERRDDDDHELPSARDDERRQTPPNHSRPQFRRPPTPERSSSGVTRSQSLEATPRTSERFLDGRPRAELDVDGLGRLGLPHGYLVEPTEARDRMSALIELAKRFPQPDQLPMSSDALIVLVGERSEMQASAEWVHDALRVDPGSMLVATRRDADPLALSRRIDDAEDAVVKRRSLRRRDHPLVVAIDEPVGRRGISWARAVLHALEPTVVWGVVDARRKPEDVADWCERLGGVDALAIIGTEETASPGAILSIGVPISLIDARPATPVRWAAVLDERLRAA